MPFGFPSEGAFSFTGIPSFVVIICTMMVFDTVTPESTEPC